MGGNLQRYQASDLPQLFDRITRNAIGMDDYFDRIFTLNESVSNYPPFNLVQVNNVEFRLEIALAGFKKEEVNVFTEFGKLFIEGKKMSLKIPLPIEALLKDHSSVVGLSLTIQRFARLSLRMGY